MIYLLISLKKIILNKNNIDNFFNKIKNKKNKKSFQSLYIGFFGYEILCNLNNIKIPKQKNLNFPQGIFYKPETIIKIRKNITIKSSFKNFNSPRIYNKFKN